MSQEAAIRLAALKCLARREYAVRELSRKLARKFPEAAVTPVVAALAEDGLVSDRRYAEAVVRSRINRGYGPRYIAAELSQQGVDPALAENELEAEPAVWLARACDLVAKRRRLQDSDERLARLLARRGFSSDVIYKALHGVSVE